MQRTVRVVTPGAGQLVGTVTCAYLSKLPGTQPVGQAERIAQQDTAVVMYTLIVPPDVPLTAESEVIDEDQHRYRVVGEPADRSNLGPVLFRAAALQQISEPRAGS